MSLAKVFQEVIIKDNNKNKKISNELTSNSLEFDKVYAALHKHLNINLIRNKKRKHIFELPIGKDIFVCKVGLLTAGRIILCMTCEVHCLYKLPKFNPVEELKRRQGIPNHKFRKIKKRLPSIHY